MYDVLTEKIKQLHPELIVEIDAADLPKNKSKYYSLGNFIEVKEEDRLHGEWNQYYIWMRMDYPGAKDPDKLAICLAHEYGHFLCRTLLYPNLGRVGRYILHKHQSRPRLKTPKDTMTNLLILIEELTAWVLAWGMMLKLGGLKKSHIQYGFKCWKSYWYRMKK